MENIDETHFVVNMDNDKTLRFSDDTLVKYAKVVSSGDSMTMVVQIFGGRSSMVEAPMLIFTNPNSNYPIRGLEDNTLGVSYWTRSKGWMDHDIFADFFEGSHAFQFLWSC